jgi:hypothetical protein
MAEPHAGVTIEELDQVDKRSADLLRRSLGASESVHLWAIGLDDQVVALSQEHAYIVKWGFAAGVPFGGKVVSLRFAEIVSTDVRIGKATGTFEIRAAGMPSADAWAGRFRRSRLQELPNVVTISEAQQGAFRQVAASIGELVSQATGPPVWIAPPR